MRLSLSRLLALAAVSVLGLAACVKTAEPVDPPAPNMDAAAAFPRFDAVYRNAGHPAGVNSGLKGLGVRYFRFFEDGAAAVQSQMTGASGIVTKGMHDDAFAALAKGSGDRTAMPGRYTVDGDAIRIELGQTISINGSTGNLSQAYDGKIVGDQLHLVRKDPETGKAMSPTVVYWPAER